MKILAPPSASRDTVAFHLPPMAGSTFRDSMFPWLWTAAVEYGIDPVGMVAQSGKETAWGTFPGNVKDWFYNPAGIKVAHDQLVMDLLATTDANHPLVHQQFQNWWVGAIAHAQHLRAYCNAPVDGLIVDPRYHLVIGRAEVVTWGELGGRWAGSPTYGIEIEDIMHRLAGSP